MIAHSGVATQASVLEVPKPQTFHGYALHYPLIWLVRGASEKLGLSSVVFGVLLVIFLPVTCAVIERRFDLPVRRWIGRSIARRVIRC